jgi:hypothetical protein
MTVMLAATRDYLLANPIARAEFKGIFFDSREEPVEDTAPEDDLVYMLYGDGNVFAIYPRDGSEITARTFVNDELDEFVANGGVIAGYNP